MKKGLLIIFFLTACGGAVEDNSSGEVDDNNRGYGYEFTDSLPNGLRVRYTGVDDRRIAPIEHINNLYTETQGCVGLTREPPLIIFLPEKIDCNTNNHSALGCALTDVGTVVVYAIPPLYYDIGEEIIRLDSNYDQTLNHEFIHHITRQGHESAYFEMCELERPLSQ